MKRFRSEISSLLSEERWWWPLFHKLGSNGEWECWNLEAGPAKSAGFRAYIGRYTDNPPVCICIHGSDVLTVDIQTDLSAHAFSAGCGILVIDDGEIWLRDLFSEPGLEFEQVSTGDLNRFTRIWRSILSRTYQEGRREAEIIRVLEPYLLALRRVLIAVIRKEHGEIPDIQLQTASTLLMLRAILFQAAYTRGISPEDLPQESFFLKAAGFISTLPVFDPYDIRIPPEPANFTLPDIKNLPVPNKIRLSWIRPVTYAGAFGRYLNQYPEKRQHRGDHEPLPEAEEENDDSLLTRWIIPQIHENIRDKDPEKLRILDPSCRCGLSIARIVDHIFTHIHRESTPQERLSLVSEIIYGFDQSPVHIAVSRFILILSAIRSEFDQISEEYPERTRFSRINEHIRCGSVLFGPDITTEFVSVTAEHERLKRIHPLDLRDIPEKGFDLILSGSSARLPEHIRETDRYLNRRYESYIYPGTASYFLPERTCSFLSEEGAGYYYIPKSWLSEEKASSFRAWVKRSPIRMIITGESEEGTILVFQQRMTDQIHIITLVSKGSEPRYHDVYRDDLPINDGWNLNDPREERIIGIMEAAGQSLSDYLMGEIYPTDRKEKRETGWVSICPDEDGLRASWAEKVQEGAIANIPGSDEYMTCLVNSHLIQWYWQVKKKNRGCSDFSIIRSIPVISIDPFRDDERRIYDTIIASGRDLTRLQRTYSYASTFHDRNRIGRRMERLTEETDRIILRLYGLSDSDYKRIHRKKDIL